MAPDLHAGIVPNVSLAQQIEQEIEAGRVELPVLPEIATKVGEMVSREASIEEIVAVIEREPAFAAAVLRYANSVAFAGLREVTELRQAVTRLGLTATGQTILAVSAQQAFTSPNPAHLPILRRLWDHSMVTAIAARRVATRIPGVSPEMAFLGGLLHDIGKVVVLRTAATLVARDKDQLVLSETALLEFFDSLHCRVGERLFESWNLPAPIRDVVRRHHDTDLTAGETLIVIVAFASHIATKMGASLKPDPSLSLLDAHAVTILRLDDVRLANLLVDIEDDIERARNIL